MRHEEGASQLQTRPPPSEMGRIFTEAVVNLGKDRKRGEGLKEKRERWVGEWMDRRMVEGR